jgi:hypothetical protein
MVNRPALSVALAVQPEVVSGLAEQASMKGRGFLARWLYSLPTSWVGSRRVAPPPVPPCLSDEYAALVKELWEKRGTVSESGPEPNWLSFSPAADHALQDFERELEPLLAEGEELSGLAGWGNKLAGAVVRLSGVFHVVECVAAKRAWSTPIAEETARAAIRLARDYLIPHSQAAFGLMGADPLVAKAKAVTRWIARKDKAEFKRHEVFNDVRNKHHFPRIEDLDPALNLLSRHHVLRIEFVDKKPGPGRPPHPVYKVSQKWTGAQKNQKNQTNGGEGGREPGEDEQFF